jgi:hypothetical protein
MNRRGTVLGLVALGTLRLVREARATGEIPVVGLLDAGARSEMWVAFRQQLRDLGYIEGRNVRFESRSAKDAFDLLAPMASSTSP